MHYQCTLVLENQDHAQNVVNPTDDSIENAYRRRSKVVTVGTEPCHLCVVNKVK